MSCAVVAEVGTPLFQLDAVAQLPPDVLIKSSAFGFSAVTAIAFWVALLPRLSIAFSVMLSGPAVPSLSVSVPRSLFTWLSVPWMTRSSVPAPVTVSPVPVAVADSRPLLSFSVTVKASPVVAPLSARLTLPIDVD